MGVSGAGQTPLRSLPNGKRTLVARGPASGQLESAVRQKTRWVHGIAFQSWSRLGWSRNSDLDAACAIGANRCRASVMLAYILFPVSMGWIAHCGFAPG